MSMGDMPHFRRVMYYNVGVIPTFNPRLNACGWKEHPCLWTNTGRKWGI